MNLKTLVSNIVHHFADKLAVIYDDGRSSHSLSYKELWQHVDELSTYFSSLQMTGKTIAVIVSHNIHLPAILLSLLGIKCSFHPLSINAKRYAIDSIQKVGASWIIHDSTLEKVHSLIAEHLPGYYIDNYVLDKFGVKLIQLNLDDNQDQNRDDGELAYCITTSGTTGSPKVIKVPHSCIVPNILDLIKIFQVNEKDTILLTSPLTFDPSIIDIFLSLSTGATLVLVPDTIKKNPDQIINVLHSRQNVTVLQATPSFVRHCSSNRLKRTILGPESSLRVLALGGEAFPSTSELRKWMDPANRTKFYNLYGITEVSCWASCEYVDVQNVIKNTDFVSIGKPLSKTLICVDTKGDSPLQRSNQGFIWIGSSERICKVDSEMPYSFPSFIEVEDSSVSKDEEKRIVWRNTGDIGKVLDDGRIEFLGRQDDQVKRNGMRMNLSALQAVCCELPWVTKCCALVNDKNELIVFFITDSDTMKFNKGVITEFDGENRIEKRQQEPSKSRVEHSPITSTQDDKDVLTPWEEEKTLWRHIQHALPRHWNPDRVVKLETFPLTAHGKLDKKKLLDIERHMEQKMEQLNSSPLSWIKQLWLTYLPKDVSNIDMKDTFLSLGGDSLAAVNLINQMEKFFDSPAQQFLDTLLNKDFSCFVNLLKDDPKLSSQFEDATALRKGSVQNTINVDSNEVLEATNQKKLVEKVNFGNSRDKKGNEESGKVDESLLKSLNRSSEISTDRSEDFQKNSCEVCIISRGNRIISVNKESKLHIVHSLLFETSKYDKLSYKECDNHRKNEAPMDKDETIVSQKRKSSIVLDGSDQAITSPSLNLKYEKKRAMTDESVSSGNSHKEFVSDELSFHQRWTVNTQKCVDASPVIAVFSQVKAVAFIGSHSGRFSAIDIDSGHIKWTTTLPDRIESSACISTDMAHVIAGCYDGVIYAMDVGTGAIEWAFQTGDSVKCSPCVDPDSGHVICGSHDGWLYSLDIEDKKCVWKHHLGGGSVFSSPVIDRQSGMIYAATLSGKLTALSCADGTLVWAADLKKPLFSSPCLHGNSILVGCVDDNLYCINHLGQTEWTFKSQGPIFSSPVSHEGFIFFGSHDHQFYCLTSSGQLMWKFKSSSPIFSTPFVFKLSHNNHNSSSHSKEPECKIIRKESPQASTMNSSFHLDSSNSHIINQEKSLVLLASTKGILNVLDCVDGKILASTDLPGEVFSSSIIHEGKVVVGCRDNLVYCFDFFQ